MHITYRQTCRVCGSHDLVPVLDLGMQYLQGSFIKEGVLDPPRRLLPTQLVRCNVSGNEKGCGLVQMAHSVPPNVLYANYWYTSGTNATMRQHLAGIVDGVLGFGRFGDKRVLDIGCNDGTLLKSYPADFELFGIDPSDIASAGDERITVFNTLFPSPALESAMGERKFDVVTSIAMFYDLEDPIGFARAVKRVLAPEGVWILEMSYLPLMLRQNSFDTVCHEHLEYYSLAVLEHIARAANLRVFKAELNGINGGSIRCYVCHDDVTAYDGPEARATLHRLRVCEFDIELDTERPYEAFEHRIKSLKSSLLRLLGDIRRAGKTVHIYGASTKGNVLLQWFGIDDSLVPYAADRNPAKWGARTIGTNISIIDEQASRAMRPDYYLVLPWHFKREFLERERGTILDGTKMIFPLPHVSVVGADNIEAEILAAEREEGMWARLLDDPSFRDDVLGLQ
jgi:SAM-dependent methyltransferase